MTRARQRDEPSPRVFWAGVVLGGAVVGWGVFGLLESRDVSVTGVNLRPWLIWFLGAVIVHDAVVAPLVHLVGSGVRRLRPVALRTPLQIGLALTALLVLFSFPLLRGYGVGTQPGNASVQPVDYATSLLVLLGVTWTLAAGLAVYEALHAKGSGEGSNADNGG